jgi:hypothetical protein
MLITTMNHLPGYMGDTWTEICAYGTAPRVSKQ